MNPSSEFGPDIWIVDGPPVRFLGVTFPTRMIAVKLGDGSLWINSPVAAPPDQMARLAAIGPVRYLVAPTALHLWRLKEGRVFFPEAELWGPPRARPSYDGLSLTGVLGDRPPESWVEDLDQLVFRGSILLDEAHFLHAKSRTLIVGDFIQNYPARGRPFWLNALARLGGVCDGGVPVDLRLTFATNRALGRQSLEKLLSWDFDNLIVAHGDCIRGNAKPFVKRAFAWLGSLREDR